LLATDGSQVEYSDVARESDEDSSAKIPTAVLKPRLCSALKTPFTTSARLHVYFPSKILDIKG
jgi:hypothetical protein